MANFSNEELFNGLGDVFPTDVSGGRSANVLNIAAEFQQLKDLASTTFLFNPDAIFYLGRLLANQLQATLAQEIGLCEDILVALDELGQIGAPVRGTSQLSNAQTTLLALDAATALEGRPEVARFDRQIAAFADQLRPNVITASQALTRPKEDARSIIQTDLGRLETTHSKLLTLLDNLRGLLPNFVAQNIPTKVSSATLTKVRASLRSLADTLTNSTDAANIAASRGALLTALTAKVAVKEVGAFSDPRNIKVRGPENPVPSTLRHSGYAAGEGTPASVVTNSGPWSLPISAPLSVKVNGQTATEVALDTRVGSVLAGAASAPFTVPATRYLHVVLDPETKTATISASTVSSVNLNAAMDLDFKHLGCPFSAPEEAVASDTYPRAITDMGVLQTFASNTWNASLHAVTVASPSAGRQGAVGLTSEHVGGYLKDVSGARFEILEVQSTTVAILADRGLTPAAGAMELRGNIAALAAQVIVSPVFTTPPTTTKLGVVGPAVKTTALTAGSDSVAQIISDVEGETGDFTSDQIGATLNWHVKAVPVDGDSGRLGLAARTRKNPYLQIVARFVKTASPVGLATLVAASVHSELGFLEGARLVPRFDANDILTVEELRGAVQDAVPLAEATVETVDLAAGSGNVAIATAVLTDATASFLANVSPRDLVELRGATAAGIHQVLTVADQALTLDAPAFTASETAVAYRVYRQQVRIASLEAGPGSSVEVWGPTELGVPSLQGTVQYGTSAGFEARNAKQELYRFDKVSVGDLLRLTGYGTYAITENQGTRLILEGGVPSNVSKAQFEIRSSAAQAYTQLKDRLDTFASSPALLTKNRLDENIDFIDQVLAQAILVGQNFKSSRERAKRVVAEFLSILTVSPRREGEYSASVPVAADNLEDALSSYSVPRVPEVDALLDAFRERKYDRAATLLAEGHLSDFYAASAESGSFAGHMMATTRAAVGDLPIQGSTQSSVEDRTTLASQETYSPDANENFSDTDGQVDYDE